MKKVSIAKVQEFVGQQVEFVEGVLGHPRVVTWAIYLSLGLFIPGIIVGLVVALFFGGSVYGPGSYSIMQNFISELGTWQYSRAPYILNGVEIACAFLLLPVFVFTRKLTIRRICQAQIPTQYNEVTKRGCMTGHVWFLVGLVGLFGSGFVPMDWDLIVHIVFASLIFLGFAVGACCYGFINLVHPTFIPRALGVTMMTLPITTVTLFGVNYVMPVPFLPIYPLQWLMMISVLWWMVPTSAIILKQIKKGVTVVQKMPY